MKIKKNGMSHQNIYSGKSGIFETNEKIETNSSISELESHLLKFCSTTNLLKTAIDKAITSESFLEDTLNNLEIKQACARLIILSPSATSKELTNEVLKIITYNNHTISKQKSEIIREIVFKNIDQIFQSCNVITDFRNRKIS